jgi:hypothetical protein
MVYIEQNTFLQNLSEQDIFLDSKDLIDLERSAMDQYDKRYGKGQMSFISSKEGLPKDHLQLVRNALNQLLVKFPANSVAPSGSESAGTFWTEYLC